MGNFRQAADSDQNMRREKSVTSASTRQLYEIISLGFTQIREEQRCNKGPRLIKGQVGPSEQLSLAY